MYYSKLAKNSIENGPGVRVVLFVSGCRNHCKGCHNPATWNFDNGEEFTEATLQKILDSLSFDYISGLTLCGGEPMEQENQVVLKELLKRVKQQYHNKTVWCYTGYEYADLVQGGKKNISDTSELLSYIDVLITGPYKQELRDITKNNLWRGSTNQRVVDLKATLANGTLSYLADIPNNS